VTIYTTENKLGTETKFDVVQQDGTILQSLTIHTSCSDDLIVGQQFGSMLLTKFIPEGSPIPESNLIFSPAGVTPMVSGAASLDLGDEKKLKWELTNNGSQDVFIENVVVTWPAEHGQVKKFKLEGDFAKDVFDDESPTSVPDDKAFEPDRNKRKLKKGDHKRLEIEFTEKYKNHTEGEFTIEVLFEGGYKVSFPAP
jgi:hypothetical protein